ncbi:MAG: hypothetical protein F6K47_43305 [Symploca sp. SIO2E6]|nr:hypothetical protein [Symploca sp. SIO2E6]
MRVVIIFPLKPTSNYALTHHLIPHPSSLITHYSFCDTGSSQYTVCRNALPVKLRIINTANIKVDNVLRYGIN